jgi:hypothetical protein
VARYFFDTDDGTQIFRDEAGVEFVNADAATKFAITRMCEVAKELPADGVERFVWTKVRDEAGIFLFVAEMTFKSLWPKV